MDIELVATNGQLLLKSFRRSRSISYNILDQAQESITSRVRHTSTLGIA